MEEVIAVALIAGGVSVCGNVATVVVSLRQSAGELGRLKVGHEEENRRARRDAYARYLSSLEYLDAALSGHTEPLTEEDFTGWLNEFRRALVDVQLVESDDVSAARKAVGKSLDSASLQGADEADTLGGFSKAYVALRPQLNEAARALTKAMKEDLEAR